MTNASLIFSMILASCILAVAVAVFAPRSRSELRRTVWNCTNKLHRKGKERRIAIVGGGMAGASCAYQLSTLAEKSGTRLRIDIFDQGRNGIGGRASHRRVHGGYEGDPKVDGLRFDHGCQFFRADTTRFRKCVERWQEQGFVREWQGTFRSIRGGDFFGLPNKPPFFTAIGGMNQLPTNLVELAAAKTNVDVHVHRGERVSNVFRNASTGKWNMLGTTGAAAYHDTKEEVARMAQVNSLASGTSYHAVVLTDVSSSFGAWHRASAGVPEEFARRVRERAGSRVPLFTTMVTFEQSLGVSESAVAMNDPTLWFAAKTSAKPGLEGCEGSLGGESWTLVSSPKFATKLIEETPMQTPDGEFIPQTKDYLRQVPGTQMARAFVELLRAEKMLQLSASRQPANDPKIVYLGAQRWGSGLKAHPALGGRDSPTRKVLINVSYDDGQADLSSTVVARAGDSFVADDENRLYQCGDMVSAYTPGLEAAALSGFELADHLHHNVIMQDDGV